MKKTQLKEHAFPLINKETSNIAYDNRWSVQKKKKKSKQSIEISQY